MATLTVTLPAKIKLTNNAEHGVSFQPYHENFSANVPAGKSLEFSVATVGQFFYYKKQAEGLGLEFTQIENYDSDPNVIVVELPALVTITNVTDHAVSFLPYRENFAVEIARDDAVVLETATLGQTLYYESQEQVNKGIRCDYAPKN